MHKIIYLSLLIAFTFSQCKAQDKLPKMDKLPYHQIPDYPEEYNACTVAARTIDGLGYRYYWATEGLRPEDLQYKPSEDARTCAETLEHLYGLSETIVNSVKGKPNIRPLPEMRLTFEQRRGLTLQNLKEASDILRKADPKEMENFKIIFQRGEKKSEFPFWHQLNGPIADALWHAGQIVVFRRASSNPINPKVNVFMGKTRE